MITQKIGLIPRYNWDYSLSDYAKALTAAFGLKPDTENSSASIEKIFGQKPIFTTSGRTSLYAILKSLNLPEGSCVGVPLFCCSVVFDAVAQAGLVPKFIDIDPEDYNLSAADLEKKKDSLSAIVVVHMFGHPADMDAISAIAGDIPIVEDCAQSLFSMYKGHRTGFLSIASFFSFRSGKYISAGEGSAIFTQRSSLSKSIRRLVGTFEEWNSCSQAMHCTATYIKSTLYKRPWYGTFGYPIGTRIDCKLNLTAKTGFRLGKIAQSDLRIIDDRIETFSEKVSRQKQNSLYLLENIKMRNVVLPREKQGYKSNYYQFAIRFPDTGQRDAMAAYLFKHGIDTAKYLDEVIDLAGEQYNYNKDCPDAEHCSKTVLVIPNHYTLLRQDLDHIVDCLNKGSHYLERKHT